MVLELCHKKSVKDILVLWLGILEKAEHMGCISVWGKRQYQYPKSSAVRDSRSQWKSGLTLQEEYEIMKCLQKAEILKSLGIPLAPRQQDVDW